MELDELRRRLSAIDRQIIDLAAERQVVVDRIGEVKLATGVATRDFSREKEVLDAARAQAIDLGLPTELAASLMQLLIHSSLTKQELARVRAEGRGHGKSALVIGGSGKMGHWFAEFLDSQGYAVTIADPVKSGPEFPWVADWQELPGDFDITVVAAPINITGQILDAFSDTGRRGLVFDVASLKSPLLPALRKLAKQGLRVTSLHPMFGPDTELLSGRHVLFLEVGVPDATREAIALFESTMAQQIEMSVDDHDRLIAFVLGLSHALNIAFFTALAESGETIPRLEELSSTTFDAQLEVAAKVAEENPYLYFEIQHDNPHGSDALAALASAVDRVRSVVEAGDREAFAQLMESGRDYLARRK
ncbi:MAG: prephenate dehydrogenase/arogenate dehydrogenase family protein [Chromatiales bacterium]|nr:MAG: prephenate dehydrogenase/arogenate dehydrogenase family protein [Chromatiales bacterium]